MPSPIPVDENVQFTVYRPRVAIPEVWYPFLAFAHLTEKRTDAPAAEPDPVQEVQRQATRVLGEVAREYQAVVQDTRAAVPRKGELTFVPEIPGIEFNPPSRTFSWRESVHREEFRLRADQALDGQTARGRLTVFLGEILLADVPLAIRIDSKHQPTGGDEPLEADHARPYRRIFASYSHKDLAIVEQFEHFARTVGDEYLRDWKHLRTGEVWDDRLLRMIEEADVFQLFWSSNAMESPHVRREWEHALSLHRPNFVRPTYWEDPLPMAPERGLPPEDLRRLHFQRIGPAFGPSTHPPTAPVAVANAPLVIGRYQVERELGQGGMGTVYQARDTSLQRTVALKVLSKVQGESPEQRERFQREMNALIQLSHPGIVPVYDAGMADGQRYIATGFVQGQSLADRLASGPLSQAETVNLTRQVAEALGYAHERGVLHRDLKPSNVLLDAAGKAQVAGFEPPPPPPSTGTQLTSMGVMTGTPSYMAPERITGGSVGPQADVFSLGVLMYEALTGRLPFQGNNVMETVLRIVQEEPVAPHVLNPAVDRALEAICLRCLAKSPRDRYGSVQEVVRDLVDLSALELDDEDSEEEDYMALGVPIEEEEDYEKPDVATPAKRRDERPAKRREKKGSYSSARRAPQLGGKKRTLALVYFLLLLLAFVGFLLWFFR